ncbi:hypothetical protein AB0I53_02390 [Saccharopolyspora sp. NPDC050389]|uniref:hypothetical protein n=1 Tax=Saccharopolyspora sp. NPDC050389 TaxID=3155516 RepID=UPI0033FBF407
MTATVADLPDNSGASTGQAGVELAEVLEESDVPPAVGFTDWAETISWAVSETERSMVNGQC